MFGLDDLVAEPLGHLNDDLRGLAGARFSCASTQFLEAP
jgi:hypothetical protein